eukprot:2597395-Amphidinium_carterae.1
MAMRAVELVVLANQGKSSFEMVLRCSFHSHQFGYILTHQHDALAMPYRILKTKQKKMKLMKTKMMIVASGRRHQLKSDLDIPTSVYGLPSYDNEFSLP